MIQNLQLRLLPAEAADAGQVKKAIAKALQTTEKNISGFRILKHSIDARGKQPRINLSVEVFNGETFRERTPMSFDFQSVQHSRKRVIIIGAGPAGLFAALKLLEAGIKPIIVERGKDVKSRRRDLAILNKEGVVNPDSNYCFGEGGAGTYSDGKLYTRSSKRGDIKRILELFVKFGAPEHILYEAHPHIGTNKLPHIITAMRELILGYGGEIHFEQKVADLELADDAVKAVILQGGGKMEADAFILATGHSARDIFELLQRKKIQIEFKPFALGVRVEHPQALIDEIQYHCPVRDPFLPPAAYSWVEQVQGRGVFSFCMCPGGIIAPASTSPGELVVNGWSPSKRNNPYANSGIVVAVEEKDCKSFAKFGALAGMHFQQMVEKQSFDAGGGKFVAPAQRLTDFVEGKSSTSLPGCSYLPGLNATSLHQVLPGFIEKSLQGAFLAAGKKMKGYMSREAIVVATESRSSSPVRIPRDPLLFSHPQYANLYPCAEGAGYAGGIVSAAMDGENCAMHAALALLSS
ncbi:MAG: NAD(P)/FAD-dependent oxidoreductase [Chitinophagaceae bacterium]|nr:NAD(P)/FAD-dependent oxidoreductase [Chitinophagaceae bacterium]